MTSSDDRRRVLVVEDEWMVAAQIEAIVSGAGFEVVGPLGDLRAALAAAETEELYAALLDVELAPGIEVYPVAHILQNRQVPFAFVTSKPRNQIAPSHADRPVVAKPFQPHQIEAVLRSFL